ncbi:MAG: flagellar type III secretion system protein FliR [Alphaproteobacteria bacterium]|nr:MAG: flagellar type III secretion system protein FliR [Alphaproteobacteria bacterium]
MPLSLLPAQIFGFFLVFSRLAALFMLAPAFGESQIPQRVRLALALTTSFLVYLAVSNELPAMPEQPWLLAVRVAHEILIGLMIAAAARLIMSALHVAGTVIAFQTSLAFSQQFDPTQGSQSAVTASFMALTGVVLIFASDLHLMVLRALLDSYALFPAQGGLPIGDFAKLVTDLVASSFTLGIKMSAPFLVFGLVFNIGLGLIARLMPQLPIFFVALPLNIATGFVLLLLVLPAVMMLFMGEFEASLAPFLGS